jgi:excisionase family DNA binding protein
VATEPPAPGAARGLTCRELARLLRVSRGRILAWIRTGELPALDVSPRGSARPRYIVTPHALAEWERSRRASQPAPPPKRHRRAAVKDFYPD